MSLEGLWLWWLEPMQRFPQGVPTMAGLQGCLDLWLPGTEPLVRRENAQYPS